MKGLTAIAFLLFVIGAATAENKEDVKTGLYEGDGHKFHIRLAINSTKKEVLATVLDGKAKKKAPIEAKTIELKITGVKDLVKLDAKDAKDGKTAEFTAPLDKLQGKTAFKDIEIWAKVNVGPPTKFELEE